VEIELLAPRGRTREDLANQLALLLGASVRRVWHTESEPSLVPGKPVFHNLSIGFEVVGESGWLLRFTDDLTLRQDLNPAAPAPTGFWRILSDDLRLLRIAARHVDPGLGPAGALDNLARLVGGRVGRVGDIWRLNDAAEAAVVMATGAPGERERACEVVTAPLPALLAVDLAERAVSVAASLGFVAPAEGAVHVHLDGAVFQEPRALFRLATLMAPRGSAIRRLVGTNPRCVRLGPWDPAITAALTTPDFARGTWEAALPALRALPWTKYVDLNLRNLVFPPPAKCTVEWRIFPVTPPGPALARQVRLAVAVGDLALSERPLPADDRVETLLGALELPDEDIRAWEAALGRPT
jgi:hypothetical protein